MAGMGRFVILLWVMFFIFTISIFLIEDYNKGSIHSICCTTIGIISITGVIFSIIMLVLGPIKLADQPFIEDTAPYSTEHLIALNDNNNIEGHFYCRRGYIEQNLYYQYMVDLGSKGYVANKASSNDTYIFYSDDNPRMEWYHSTHSWWCFSETKTIRKLYIPKGTIAEDFNIDLK